MCVSVFDEQETLQTSYIKLCEFKFSATFLKPNLFVGEHLALFNSSLFFIFSFRMEFMLMLFYVKLRPSWECIHVNEYFGSVEHELGGRPLNDPSHDFIIMCKIIFAHHWCEHLSRALYFALWRECEWCFHSIA